MNLQTLRVRDLFFNIRGIEHRLFNQKGSPWSALSLLGVVLNKICETSSRSVFHNPDKREMNCRQSAFCPHPTLGDEIHFGIASTASIDFHRNRIRAAKGIRIDGAAKITGPVFFGAFLDIRHGAAILGDVIFGDGESYAGVDLKDGEPGMGGILGRQVTAHRAIIRGSRQETEKRYPDKNGTKIEAHTDIVDTIIGQDVYIGPGTQFGHETFSGKEVLITRFNGEEFDPPLKTGRKKLGAIIGDGCKIGAGVTFYPGVILLPGCSVHGGQTVRTGIYTPEYFT